MGEMKEIPAGIQVQHPGILESEEVVALPGKTLRT